MPAPRPLVILLHSSAGSSRQWDSLATLLEPRFRVLAIDLHGHGQRPAWAGTGSMTLADEAHLALAPLLAEDGSAHVVGHSYGGAVALRLASMAPQAVRSVLVYEPVLFRWAFDDAATQREVGRDFLDGVDTIGVCLDRGDRHGAGRRFIDFWSGKGTWAAMPPGPQQKVADRMPAVFAQFDTLFHEPLAPEQLARMEVPMSFLSGADTVAVTRRIAAAARAALPRAGHAALAGMGHMGPITHAARVNERIVEHLQAHAFSSAPLEAVA